MSARKKYKRCEWLTVSANGRLMRCDAVDYTQCRKSKNKMIFSDMCLRSGGVCPAPVVAPLTETGGSSTAYCPKCGALLALMEYRHD